MTAGPLSLDHFAIIMESDLTISRVCITASHVYHLHAFNSNIGCLGFWFDFYLFLVQ